VSRALALTAWSLAALAGAAALAVVEVLWVPLRIGGVLVPVSVVAAVVGTPVLVELVLRGSRSRAVAVLPAVAWVCVAAGASLRRPEGDLLIVAGGGLGAVGLAFLLLGALSAVAAVARVLSRPGPGGSGSGGAR
jgi:hypothetical protein